MCYGFTKHKLYLFLTPVVGSGGLNLHVGRGAQPVIIKPTELGLNEYWFYTLSTSLVIIHLNSSKGNQKIWNSNKSIRQNHTLNYYDLKKGINVQNKIMLNIQAKFDKQSEIISCVFGVTTQELIILLTSNKVLESSDTHVHN